MKRMTSMILGIVIPAMLVVVLLVPIINHIDSDIPSDYWQYDDYREISNVTGASGSLELVDGEVHAKEIGTGTMTFADGHTESVDVHKAVLDVVFMWGQSNAAYRNADPETATAVDKGAAWYYGTETYSAAIDHAGMVLTDCDMWTMVDDTGAVRIGDKAPAFCQTYYERTHHKVYWVDGAIGNKSLSSFLPFNGDMWKYGKSVLEAALDEIDEDHFDWSLKYYMWIQGEANSASPVASYKSQFLSMHEAMLRGNLGEKFQGCFISKVRAINGVNSSQAQIELCEEVNTIHMATELADTFTVANGLMGSDDLHYSQAGNNVLGAALANAIVDYDTADSINVSSAEKALITIIPLLILAGLAIAAVVFITRVRD